MESFRESLESGDLILFEPYLQETNDYFRRLSNWTTFGNVGIVLKRNGQCFCIQANDRNEYGKFHVTITSLIDLTKSYGGQLWVKKLDHPRGIDFEIQLERAIKQLQHISASLTSEYGPGGISYIYKYIGILPIETLWMETTMKSFEGRNYNLLWLYPFRSPTKI